uniref:Uncharacterized protein n=1 Tax=Mesocestoides corti TaxID=53468 RepID=A0A5K3FUJ3_MESCO
MMSPSSKSTRAKSLVNYSHGPLTSQIWSAGSVELDILPTLDVNSSEVNQARSQSCVSSCSNGMRGRPAANQRMTRMRCSI